MLRENKVLLALVAAVMLNLITASAHAGFATAIASLDSISVSTTGTADVFFTEFDDIYDAFAAADGGAPAFDAFFADSFGPGALATATNAPGGDTTASESLAEAAAASGEMYWAGASTFVDLGMELSGVGTLTIEIGYSLYGDTFDNLDTYGGGFAIAGIEAGTTFGPLVGDSADVGSFGFFDYSDILTLTVDVDDFGFGPYSEFLSIATFAEAKANMVPEPSTALLLGSMLFGVTGIRRQKRQ